MDRGGGRGALIAALKKKALVQGESGESSEALPPPVMDPAPVPVVESPIPRPLLPTRSIRPVTQPPPLPTRSNFPVTRPPQLPTRSVPSLPARLPTRSVTSLPPRTEAPIFPSKLPPSSPFTGIARGRVNLLETTTKQASIPESHPIPAVPPAAVPLAAVPPAAVPPAVVPRVGMGRASRICKLTEQRTLPPFPAEPLPPHPESPSPPPARPMPRASGDNLGVTGSLAGMALGEQSGGSGSDLSAPISRMGSSGEPVNIMSNYLGLTNNPDKGIFRYETRFDPETDSPRVRNALLNQHLQLLGKCKIFDGVLLYVPNRLTEAQTTLESIRHDNVRVTITLIFQKHQRPSESVQFYNILLGKVMNCLKMVRINRSNFNPRCAHKIEQHKMELWPGYVTAIEEVEGGLKLNIDASHRVMRTNTVRDYMGELLRQSHNKGNFRAAATAELLGMTVLTRYNNKTYRIDDIHWDKTPAFTFDCKGTETSLAEYYKAHWSMEIMDMKQPLIYHKAKKKLPQGGTQEDEVLLIPELCYLTGLTDKLRNDFKIMRDLATITQVVPEQRRNVIRKFIQDVKNTPIANELLQYWGLQIEDDLTKLKGRVLSPEIIHFGNGSTFKVNDRADWGRPATTNPLLRSDGMKNWFICFTERDQRVADEFIKMLKRVGGTMKMDIGNPQKVALRNDTTQSYVQEIRKAINPELEMIVAIVPTVRLDRYSAIKKVCCVESPIRSQVIVTKTISDERKIKAVAEKIAIQMNCKLGGAPWALVMPFEDVMLVGIDVYHPPANQPKTGSVTGFVASLDKAMTTWHSSTAIQGPHQEVIDILKACIVSALNAYSRRRGTYPDRIIVYRDGVGDGQLNFIAEYEIGQLKDAFKLIDPSYSPKLTVIIVQKRINTRVMMLKGNNLQNPVPGTIVDSVVTRRNWYDFFLVPQTAKQGTVTPTHYIVLLDEAGFKTDHLQRLSYKLCHLYYNWPGTIRVPAPCQYAHKLAYLVGQNIQARPSDLLSECLYYL
ncbi:piwi-like protein 1 [Diachasmimorpha longicaudata]|uniref:piwi-like protein 1 n=1 Tax=Diachasmimorpha longicaudata TaxID=58733 RepID=UPI0030B90D82